MSEHPVDILLDALRVGPADLLTLSHRTGFYPGAVLSLVVRARASGFHVNVTRLNDVTTYSLEEETVDDDGTVRVHTVGDTHPEAGEPTPESSDD